MMNTITHEHLVSFSRFYADIHRLDAAYTSTSAMAAHRRAAEKLYKQSAGFVADMPWGEVDSALDVGMGYGFHCAEFTRRGCETTGITTHLPDELAEHAAEHDYRAIKMDMHALDFEDGSFDLVWSSHSLEHSFSPLFALREWLRVCRPGGLLAVTVPPHKSQVVSGHFTTGWSIGQLAYMLAVAGCDCREGVFVKEGYNIRGLVRKPKTPLPDDGASWMFALRDRLPATIVDSMIELPNSLGRFVFEGAIQSEAAHA